MTYTPARNITVTDADKRLFWAAIGGEQLDLPGIARRTGLGFEKVAEIFAQGVAAGALEFIDQGPGWRWVQRKVAA